MEYIARDVRSPSSSGQQLYVLGDNRDGQAGVGGEELQTHPVQVTAFDANELRRIVGNSHQTFAILFNGSLLSAGENENSELCRPGKRSIFQRIDMLETFKIIDVAAGEGFFHFLCQNGQILSYGKNHMGQLGTGNRDPKEKPRVNTNIKDPLIQIVCGLHHTAALTKSGQVITWGGNSKGQLGDGQLTSSINPIPLIQLRHRPVISIACGEYHTVVMTSGGNLYSWGANDNGQLGQGDTTARLRPELIRSLRANKTVHIACGRNHTMFIASNHLLFATGSNTHGQCGQELAFRQILTPTVVEYFREKVTLDVSCGALHTFIIACTTSNPHKRRLYVMGSNGCGQLGLDSLKSTEYPQLSIFDANVIEAIFTSPLSLTSYLLTRQHLSATTAASSAAAATTVYDESENQHQRETSISVSRVRMLPSVTTENIITMLHRLPKDPTASQANQRSSIDQYVRDIRETISSAFSSISVLNASFLVATSSGALSTNSSSSSVSASSPLCVDLYAVRRAYDAILSVETSYPNIVVTLGRTLVHICDELKECPFDDIETLSVFFILLENPLLLRIRDYHIVLEKLVQSILSLPKLLRLELFKRMKAYPSEFFARVVSLMMEFLHFILTNKIVGLDTTPVIWVLETLYTCSIEMDNIVPHHVFHHPSLPTIINLAQEWQRYQESRAQQLSQVVNYWQYPFLINETYKYHILQSEYQRRRVSYVHILSTRYDVSNVLRHLLQVHTQQQQDADGELTTVTINRDEIGQQLKAYLPAHVKAVIAERVVSTPSPTATPSIQLTYTVNSLVFYVRIRRSHLLEDFRSILSVVLQSESEALWLPLKVEFDGELGEDIGGLTKELFTLTIRALLQETSAFRLSGSGQVYWFTNTTTTAATGTTSSDLISWEYMLGLVQSLAIYHGIHIDVPLPSAIYKILKGRDFTLQDLAAADHALAHGLHMLLQYPDGNASIEDAFGVTFIASSNPLLDISNVSSSATMSLVHKGEEKLVTRGNRQEFVSLFVRHSLHGCCASSIDVYIQGVKRLIGQDIWMLCSHEELEILIAGVSLTESLTTMRPVSVYVGDVFHDLHPVIQWFWEVVAEFTVIQKKQFLLFVSGNERAPIGGLKKFVLTIQSTEQDEQSLPSSRTCFNLLFLSRNYSSKEIVREKLIIAIEHSQGFGLI